MRDTILFDMDGTLLQVDTDGFIQRYFQLLTLYFREEIAPERMGPALKKAVAAMMSEVGQSNYDVFCQVFHRELGEQDHVHEPKFREFYVEEFDKLRPTVAANAKMQQAFAILKGKGYRFALATNPAFPLVAQEKRLRWGGFDPADFQLITGCDNSVACKPFREYYREITDKLGVLPEDCYMVGNDVADDMVAQGYGFDTYLITDHLVNKSGADYAGKSGDSSDFLRFVQELCTVS